MAHKQPDFRQNPPPANREGGRTDEVIGRFQPAASASTTAGGATSQPMSTSTREEAGRGSGAGLGRFFRAASERLTRGRAQGRDTFRSDVREPGRETRQESFGQGLREGSYRDDTRSFDDMRGVEARRSGRSGSG